MLGLFEQGHSKVLKVQAHLTIDTGEKKSLPDVVEFLADEYLKRRKK